MIVHSTAIPPLDSPISPSFFGQERERSYNSITRHQAFRASVLSPSQLKEINDFRKASQTVVNKLGLSIEKSVYWMPDKVISCFEDELRVLEERAKELVNNIVGGDLDEFMENNRSSVKEDFEVAYRQINKTQKVPSYLIPKLMNQLRSRIEVAMKGPIVARVTYSTVKFKFDQNSQFEAPWTQAEKLILGLVKFPRINILKIDSLFFESIDPEKLLEYMDIGNDNILKIWKEDREKATRCAKADLNIVKWIEDADIENRQRCQACFMLMRGDRSGDIIRFVEENRRV